MNESTGLFLRICDLTLGSLGRISLLATDAPVGTAAQQVAAFKAIDRFADEARGVLREAQTLLR